MFFKNTALFEYLSGKKKFFVVGGANIIMAPNDIYLL